MSKPSRSFKLASAFNAHACAPAHNCIVLSVFMSVLAMSLGLLLCCPGALSGAWTNTARNVYFLRDGFEMSRVDTGFYAAQMIYNESIRDRPKSYLVAHSVRSVSDPFAVNFYPYSSVTGGDSSADPHPAAAIGLWNVVFVKPAKYVRTVHSLMIAQLRNYKGEL